MNTLKTVRTSQHLTLPLLARKSGISASTIWRIERGTTTPRPHSVQRLCAALGIHPEEIVEFRGTVERMRLPGRLLPHLKRSGAVNPATSVASRATSPGSQDMTLTVGMSARDDLPQPPTFSRGRSPPPRPVQRDETSGGPV